MHARTEAFDTYIILIYNLYVNLTYTVCLGGRYVPKEINIHQSK
jgi:hypothetical protein